MYKPKSCHFALPYDDSSLRKSAVQIPWITLSMITVSPNVTSSELNGEISKRANSHCSATPIAKNAGTMIASASSGSTPAPPSW